MNLMNLKRKKKKKCRTCKRTVDCPYVIYKDSKVHCLKCYHSSGASVAIFHK